MDEDVITGYGCTQDNVNAQNIFYSDICPTKDHHNMHIYAPESSYPKENDEITRICNNVDIYGLHTL